MVAVVDVRVVRMAVQHARVPVRMRVGFRSVPIEVVRVAMVLDCYGNRMLLSLTILTQRRVSAATNALNSAGERLTANGTRRLA